MVWVIVTCLYAFGAISLFITCMVSDERFDVSTFVFCVLWPLVAALMGVAACLALALGQRVEAVRGYRDT